MHTFVPPPKSWSFELPPRLKLKIAEAITLFSRIDTVIIEARWANEQADLARKKEIAKAPAAANIAALREMVEGLPGAATENIWSAFDRLKSDRNLIGHGVWMIDDHYVPWVVWHSKFLEDDNYTVGEQFPYERFDQLLRIGNHLFATLTTFKSLLEKMALEKEALE